MKRLLAVITVALVAASSVRAEPPVVDHQPSPCTVGDLPITLCATISDDGQVGAARIYFRSAGEKYYNFVNMAFMGLNHCGTLPAPRAGKVKAIEYYVQAVDDQYESQRTNTYNLNVQDVTLCEFPPVEKDPARAAAIKVHATNAKQGKKLPDEFAGTGVSFVPVVSK
jgi:hypothetical protein